METAETPQPQEVEEVVGEWEKTPPFWVKFFVFFVALVLFFVGFRYYQVSSDYDAHRPLRPGVTAVLAAKSAEVVYVARDRAVGTDLVRALAEKDTAALERLTGEGKVTPLPPGTPVVVTREWFGQRAVRVKEGDKAGLEGWVQHEWLQAAR